MYKEEKRKEEAILTSGATQDHRHIMSTLSSLLRCSRSLT
jgi:hypothetical protein